MEEDRKRDRLRSFVIGGIVGAGAVLATRRKQPKTPLRITPAGLAAFEDAPCYRELVESERSGVDGS